MSGTPRLTTERAVAIWMCATAAIQGAGIWLRPENDAYRWAYVWPGLQFIALTMLPSAFMGRRIGTAKVVGWRALMWGAEIPVAALGLLVVCALLGWMIGSIWATGTAMYIAMYAWTLKWAILISTVVWAGVCCALRAETEG